MFDPIVSRLRMLSGAGLLALLAGCASMPASGPTGGEVVHGVSSAKNTLGMRLVDIDAGVVARLSAAGAAVDGRIATLASLTQGGEVDVVGQGDTLAISVFEVGVGLFGSGQSPTGGFDPSAKTQLFPAVVVDRDGAIKLPYVGRLIVAGRTPNEIQEMIERAYHGQSQSPQALVSIRSNISETVYVTGDVRRPGRIELTLQREHLLDAIATAGGAVTQTQDMVVRFTRGTRRVEQRLDRIHAGAPDDLVLLAGDRIELVRSPQSFVVLGATGKVAQVPFDQSDLSLTEAIARAGGPSDATADPRSIFLFRYDPGATGTESVPTIYRLDLMQPASYFLSQRVALRDKDVIYIGNASVNRTAKFVGIINQLFSPFVTARAVSR